MTSPDDGLASFMDASAAFLDLQIADAFRPGVLENLRTLRQFAALVADFPLDGAMEAAPVFEP